MNLDEISRLSLLITLFLLTTVPLVSAHDITVPTNAYFGLPIYGTYINFNTETTFDNVYRENSYWYFDGYGFQVQNANMTITKFFTDNELKFMVSAPSGTSAAKVYCAEKGKPTTVSGVSSWNYSEVTRIVTITVAHSSEQEIIIKWLRVGPGLPTTYFPLNVTVIKDNKPISEAKVTVRKVTGEPTTKFTNIDGYIIFEGLSRGTYTVTVEHAYNVSRTETKTEIQTKTFDLQSRKTVVFDFTEQIETKPTFNWKEFVNKNGFIITLTIIAIAILYGIKQNKRK